MLAAFIATIQEVDKLATRMKKISATTELLLLATDAKKNLAEKNGDVSKITKKEICSLMLSCYAKYADEAKYSKPALIEMLAELIRKSPESVVPDPELTTLAAIPAALIVVPAVIPAALRAVAVIPEADEIVEPN